MTRLKVLPHTKRDLEIAGFGSASCDALSGKRVTAGLTVIGRHAIDLVHQDAARADFLERCPKSPGVYGMIDASGSVIYVGKSKNLRARLSTYMRAEGLEEKEGRVRFQARQLVWEELPDEFGCLVREIELIDLLKPKLNIRDNPNRRSGAYICLSNISAPYFSLSRSRPYDAIEAAGPVFPSRELREAVNRLNDLFRLADCPRPVAMAFRGEASQATTEAGCFRADIGKCLAPCRGDCSRAEYDGAVELAREFFYGSKEVFRRITERIGSAIERLAFEEARELDRVKELLAVARGALDEVARRRKSLSFVYIPKTKVGDVHWYVVNNAVVEHVVAAPKDAEAFASLEKLVSGCCRVKGRKRPLMRENASVTEAWFKSNPSELERTMSFDAVLEWCDRARSDDGEPAKVDFPILPFS